MQLGFGGVSDYLKKLISVSAQMFPLPILRPLKQHEHVSLTERCNKTKALLFKNLNFAL